MQHSRSGRAERKQGDKTGGHAEKRSEQELGKADPQRTGHQIDERERDDRNHPNKRYSQHSVADELLANTSAALARIPVTAATRPIPGSRVAAVITTRRMTGKATSPPTTKTATTSNTARHPVHSPRKPVNASGVATSLRGVNFHARPNNAKIANAPTNIKN